jgi:chromosome segregation ATPase
VSELLTTTGSVTVVGVLLVGIVALYLGLVTPRHTVQEMRTRLVEREAETKLLHEDNIKQREEKAELRGQLGAMRSQLAGLEAEMEALRRELRHLREGRTA